MGSYLPLFSIEVEHRFFFAGLCPVLDFVPTPKTNVVIEKTGLLTRNTINGIRLFYDENRSDSLQLYAADPAEPLNFGFKVFSKDPFFQNYTNLPVAKEDTILYFDNRNVKSETTGRLRLHDEEYVSETDFVRMDSPLLADSLSKKDRLVKPVCVVNICISENESSLFDEPSKAISKSYYLKFQARQTFWKYYLLGDMARENLHIADLDSETEFASAGVESLSDNRTALTFRSKTTLPLQERSTYRFQLRDGNSGGGKVLIRRLPVAPASQIYQEVIDGQEAFVSEMFINC